MRIPRQLSALAFALLVVAGCGDRPPEPPRLSEALPNIPLPPLASVVSRSGGPDALEITFRSSISRDSMAEIYRRILTSGEWNLVSDTKTADGTIALYAERNGPPLWVNIRKDPEGAGTLMTIAGAVIKPDSAATGDTTKHS